MQDVTPVNLRRRISFALIRAGFHVKRCKRHWRHPVQILPFASATSSGKAVFFPSLDSPTSDLSLGVYDISLGFFSAVKTLTNQTWKGAAAVGDLVILAPSLRNPVSSSDAQSVGIFNSTDETFEEIPIGAIPGNGTLFRGAVVAKQELVVFVPDSAYHWRLQCHEEELPGSHERCYAGCVQAWRSSSGRRLDGVPTPCTGLHRPA